MFCVFMCMCFSHTIIQFETSANSLLQESYLDICYQTFFQIISIAEFSILLDLPAALT